MSKEQFLPVALQAAQANGLNPALFAAQLEQESSWNPNAKSKAGATGIAQFMPATARQMGVDPRDPVASINAAAKYMAQLKHKFGSEDLARQAYNWGEGNLSKHLARGGKGKMPSETANYNEAIAKRATQYVKMGDMKNQAIPSPAPAAKEAAPRRMVQTPSTEQALQMAMAEMNAGLPPGALFAQQQPAEMAALPTGDDDMGASVQPWQQALAALTPTAQVSGPTQLPPSEDMFASLQDEAARKQDNMMAGLFSDIAAVQQEDTTRLPASVDRYLDKILTA